MKDMTTEGWAVSESKEYGFLRDPPSSLGMASGDRLDSWLVQGNPTPLTGPEVDTWPQGVN